MATLLSFDNFCLDYLKTGATIASDAENYNYYSTLLESVDRYFKKECDFDFEAQSYSEIYSGDGGDILELKNRPINSVTTLKIDDLEIPAEDITVYEDFIIIDNDEFTFGRNNVEITYNAGYSTIPGDIQMAIGLHGSLIHRLNSKGDNRVGKIREGFKDRDTSEYVESHVPDFTQKIIKKYKDQRNIRYI